VVGWSRELAAFDGESDGSGREWAEGILGEVLASVVSTGKLSYFLTQMLDDIDV
jgi:hypothetical protein